MRSGVLSPTGSPASVHRDALANYLDDADAYMPTLETLGDAEAAILVSVQENQVGRMAWRQCRPGASLSLSAPSLLSAW